MTLTFEKIETYRDSVKVKQHK